MNVKSDGGSRQHHYTTKSITILYVPTRQVPWPSRGRVRKPHAGGQEKQAPPRTSGTITTTPCTKKWMHLEQYVPRAPVVTLPRAPGGRRQRRGGGHRGGGQGVRWGLSLREHAISRSWCYSYLNCFKTNITERTVR